MKKLVLFSLSVVATAAMAAGPSPAEIEIAGKSTQVAVLHTSAVLNVANGSMSNAQQNLASNAGNVDIKKSGNSFQIVGAQGSVFANISNANTKATQNVSSNSGDIDISGTSVQVTSAYNSAVLNFATGKGAKAMQNIASNSSCATCL